MVFLGAETDINVQQRYFNYTTMKYESNVSPTVTYAPQRTLSYALQYSPQIILGSPYASQGYGGQLTPQVAPQVTVIPSVIQSQQDTPQVQEAEMKAGSTRGGDDLLSTGLGIALIAGVGFLAYRYFLKKKKKVKRRKRG